MPYTPTTWVNDSTPLDATNMNKIELGLEGAAATAEAAIPKALSGVATDKVPVYNGSDWVAQKIVNAQIDAAAAIAGSKLATGISGPPGAELAVASVTANVTISSTTEGTADTIVTLGAVTFDGSVTALVEVTIPTLQVGSNAAGNFCVIVLYEDGSSIGKLGDFGTNANAVNELPILVRRRLVPASGSRTYSIRAYRTNANCTVVAGAGGSGAYVPVIARLLKA